MTAHQKDFSVIVPCHNYSQFLNDSVGSALAQKGVALEVIVVDDGSTDDIVAVVDKIGDSRVRLIHQPHSGIGAARNSGVGEAKGDFLAFLDADDTWREDRLVRARQTISEHPGTSLGFAMVQEFLDPSIELIHGAVPQVRKMAGISASACVMQRDVFDIVGKFDEDLEAGEFIDWYIRAQRCDIESIVDPEVLVFRRIHGYNRDRRSRDSSKEYARILMRKIRSSTKNE
jgi:glycosyltransferase involved in cell wall biosynthesis